MESILTNLRKNEVQTRVKEGWNSQLANFSAFLEITDHNNLKKKAFDDFSKKFEPFEEVHLMFNRVRNNLRSLLID